MAHLQSYIAYLALYVSDILEAYIMYNRRANSCPTSSRRFSGVPRQGPGERGGERSRRRQRRNQM